MDKNSEIFIQTKACIRTKMYTEINLHYIAVNLK